MSENVACYCDFCNQGQSSTLRHDRGYIQFATHQEAIDNFDWVMVFNKIMCIDCQGDMRRLTMEGRKR